MREVTGIQPVREAIAAHGARVNKVLIETKESPTLDALARFAEGRGVAVSRVSRSELDRRTKNGMHQGALAFVPELRIGSLEEFLGALEGTPLVVALDEIEDPQNFGAVIRSAVALGSAAILWPENHSAPLSPATFRASAGAIEHATLVRVPSLPEALENLKVAGFSVVGLDGSATGAFAEQDLRGKLVLVIGAEGKGLRKVVKAACDAIARLPMKGPIASLNASVAAAIALYEAAKQRGADELSPTDSK